MSSASAARIKRETGERGEQGQREQADHGRRVLGDGWVVGGRAFIRGGHGRLKGPGTVSWVDAKGLLRFSAADHAMRGVCYSILDAMHPTRMWTPPLASRTPSSSPRSRPPCVPASPDSSLVLLARAGPRRPRVGPGHHNNANHEDKVADAQGEGREGRPQHRHRRGAPGTPRHRTCPRRRDHQGPPVQDRGRPQERRRDLARVYNDLAPLVTASAPASAKKSIAKDTMKKAESKAKAAAKEVADAAAARSI